MTFSQLLDLVAEHQLWQERRQKFIKGK